MQAILGVTLTIVLVVCTGQARYAQGPGLSENFVSQMNQAEPIIHKTELHHNRARSGQVHMHVDLNTPHAGAETKNDTKPIPDLLDKLGLISLATKLRKANLHDTLAGKGPFTVCGPTDDAFDQMPKWAKKAIKNETVLAEFLKFHVLKGSVKSSDLLKNEFLADTLRGDKLRVNIYQKGQKTVATAQCAPINLTNVDNLASNGVIHVLNSVAIPPSGDAVTVLAVEKKFSILVEAVKAAGLVETLSQGGPFTIFAPTNEGFGILPPGTLHKLMKNPVELAKILKYHLLPGTVCSAGLANGDVKTVEGQNVDIEVYADHVKVGGATVTRADWSITNGVIHVIDTVLLPPAPYL